MLSNQCIEVAEWKEKVLPKERRITDQWLVY